MTRQTRSTETLQDVKPCNSFVANLFIHISEKGLTWSYRWRRQIPICMQTSTRSQKVVRTSKTPVLSFLRDIQKNKESNSVIDSVMAQVVRSRPPTADARVRSRVGPCGIFGGQSGFGTGFSTSTSVFPYQFHSTRAPLVVKNEKTNHISHLHLHHKGCTISLNLLLQEIKSCDNFHLMSLGGWGSAKPFCNL
jgi:hypothetical protein